VLLLLLWSLLQVLHACRLLLYSWHGSCGLLLLHGAPGHHAVASHADSCCLQGTACTADKVTFN
jgi:hypothetical protein